MTLKNINDFNALAKSLSKARIDEYVRHADGDIELAIQRYILNANIARSFLFPLGVAEVVLRNAVDEALADKYGETWQIEEAFVESLNSHCERRIFEGSVRDLRKSGKGTNRDTLIPNLPFDFWSGIFSTKHNEYVEIWNSRINIIFPNIPYSNTNQATIDNMTTKIVYFRNRIAHHEPIYRKRDRISDVYGSIVELVGFRCKITSAWMKENSTVAEFLKAQ